MTYKIPNKKLFFRLVSKLKAHFSKAHPLPALQTHLVQVSKSPSEKCIHRALKSFKKVEFGSHSE